MGKKAPCRDVLAGKKLVATLGKDLFEQLKGLLLKERFSHGDNFEKLHASEQSAIVFSIRLNQKARLLLTRYELDGQHYWVILEYLENHQYKRSKYLQKGFRLRDYLSQKEVQQQLRTLRDEQNRIAGAGDSTEEVGAKEELKRDDSSASSTPATEGAGPARPVATAETIHQELHFFNRELIVLSEAQGKALAMSEPMLLTGMPGAGKSCVALTYLTKCLENTALDAPPLLYVTDSERLAHSMRTTFLASPLGKTLPEGRVLFLSYEALVHREHPELIKMERVGKASFAEWLNSLNDAKGVMLKKWLGPKAAELIYQELRMMSALSLEQYKALGKRASPLFNINSLPDELAEKVDASRPGSEVWAREKLQGDIYDLKRAYCQYLEGKKWYDLSFLRLNAAGKYSHIAVDEAQDFSTLQLQNLHTLAVTQQKKPCIACFADSNQSVEDNFPKQDFFKTFLGIENFGELPGTFRCSKAVLQLANEVLGMKYHLTGGTMEKGVRAFIECPPGTAEGSAQLIAEDVAQQDDASKQHLAQLIGTPHCAVITHEEHLAQARERFPGTIILTPKQAKGLEYPAIILYRMFDRPCYSEMNPLLAQYKPQVTKGVVHRAKAGEAQYDYNAHLNELFTAITRAKDRVFFMQDMASEKALHPIRHLLNAVRAGLGQTLDPPKTTSVPAVDMDWGSAIVNLIETGNVSQAQKLAELHLKMDETAFNYKFSDALSLVTYSSAPKLESKESKTDRGDVKNNLPSPVRLEVEKEVEPTRRSDDKEWKEGKASVRKKRVLGTQLSEKRQKAIAQDVAKSFFPRKRTDAMLAVLAPQVYKKSLYNAVLDFVKQDDFGEQLFHIDIEEGVSLLEHMTYEAETMLGLVLKKEEFAKKITATQLLRKRTLYKLVPATLLYCLTMASNRVKMLSNLLKANPELLQSDLFTVELYEALPAKAQKFANTTAFYWLSCSPEGRELLQDLIDKKVIVINQIFLRALCRARTEAAGSEMNVTALYWMCHAEAGLKFLKKHIDKNPRLFAVEELMEALCHALVVTKSVHGNATAIYWLCGQPCGIEILDKLIRTNPSLFAQKNFAQALCRPLRAEGPLLNTTGLYFLCPDLKGIALLSKIIDVNPRLVFDEVFIMALKTTIEDGDKRTSAIACLKATEAGNNLLLKMSNLNSYLRFELYVMERENLLIDSGKDKQASAGTVEETPDHRFFTSLPAAAISVSESSSQATPGGQ